MIDVQVLVDKLQTDTSYTIELAKAKEPDLQEAVTLPILYIGYMDINSKHPHMPQELTMLHSHGEDLVQSFDIQIVCKAVDLPTIWKTIYSSLIGYNPSPNEIMHSAFTYSQGGVMGLANGNLWWVDRWRIGFPVVDVTF